MPPMPAPQPDRCGDCWKLEGGAGVGRMHRYVVFVEGAFPGELVRAEVFRSKRDYANARAVEVLEPSPDRVPQRCDHGGRPCPGSPWQELRYERQLELKHELVGDAMRRLGHLEGFDLEPIVPTETEATGARALLDRLPEGFLAIHPGSGSPRKSWPPERFATYLIDAWSRLLLV